MCKQVLIVDDEPDIRDGVSRWLRHAGFDTHTACDGQEGIESVKSSQPDVILLDMLMPRKDGMQTLSELKSDANTASIPVVMLSASLRDEQKALEAGAKFFLHKPYGGKILVSAVSAALVNGH